MILENRTCYRTADLEAIIRAGLAEFSIKSGRERVHVVYGRAFSGFCYYPWSRPLPKGTRTRKHTGARMVLRVPRPRFPACDLGTVDEASRCDRHGFDVAEFVWLVRHEIGHWRGLKHPQMAPMMRHRKVWEAGAGDVPPRSLAPWAAGMRVGVEPVEPSRRKLRWDPNDVREKRAEHARTMLARAKRRAKLAATIEKRWTRRVASAERAIETAASRPR